MNTLKRNVDVMNYCRPSTLARVWYGSMLEEDGFLLVALMWTVATDS